MPAWPASLPQEPNNGKYRETPPDVLIRDKNEVGPDSVRRRAVAAVRRLSLPYQFDPEQTDAFLSWFETDLAGGSLSFDFPWPPAPRSTQTVTARLVCPPPPTLEHLGAGVHAVTLEMEILP